MLFMDDVEMLLRAANSLRAESSDFLDMGDEPLTLYQACDLLLKRELYKSLDSIETHLKNLLTVAHGLSDTLH